MSRLTPQSAERPSTIPWPPLLIAGALAAAWVLGRTVPLSWPGVDDTPASVFGYALGLAGLALIVWAARTLRRHSTTILPNKGADVLVTDGPFYYRRNPIYLGDVMIFLSLAEWTKNIWFVAAAGAFAVFVTQLAILPEERHLEEKFGDAYRAYKTKTRRWI